MREIEFRAWDKRLKIMITHEEFLECGRLMILKMKQLYGDQPDVKNAKGGIMLTIDDENMEFMQYTGLRDSKRTDEFPQGQKIYEGDLLKYKSNNDSRIGEIVFTQQMFTYKEFFRWNLQEDEVVGNIYDNPELAT